MGIKAMILCHLGESLDDKLKIKIKKAISLAIVDSDVTDFYFANLDESCDNDFDEEDNKKK